MLNKQSIMAIFRLGIVSYLDLDTIIVNKICKHTTPIMVKS